MTDPVELSYWFAADRYRHMRDVVIPALMDQRIVVTDRSVYSNIVYQQAQGLTESFIRSIQPPNIQWPDTVIWINFNPYTSAARSGDPRFTEAAIYNRMVFQCRCISVKDSFEAVDLLKEMLKL
jgi:thymidylate kinase